MTHALPRQMSQMTADDVLSFVIPEARKGADWRRVEELRARAAQTIADLDRQLRLCEDRLDLVQRELRSRNAVNPDTDALLPTAKRPDDVPPGVVRMMTAAQRHADDVVAGAQREAARIVSEAQTQANNILDAARQRAETAAAAIEAARFPGPPDVTWLQMAHGSIVSIAAQANTIAAQAAYAAQTLNDKLAELDGGAAQPAPSVNGRHGSG